MKYAFEEQHKRQKKKQNLKLLNENSFEITYTSKYILYYIK